MLETARCRLRPIEAADLELLYVYRNDPAIMTGLGGFSFGYSMSDLAAWLEYHRSRSDEVLWAIADDESNSCIGHVGLYQIDHRVRKAEYAILIGAPRYQSKGLGREITQTVLDYGFDECNLHKISLTVLETNERAISLYRSLGFQVEGRLRDDQFRGGRYIDVIAMSLLRSEWQPDRE